MPTTILLGEVTEQGPLYTTEEQKELAKWNRPYQFRAYPRMLYKAQLNPISGRHEVAMSRDVISADKTVVILSAEQFNTSCQLIVNDESEYARARDEGWRDTPADALAFQRKLEDAVADAAAYREHEDRNMSAAAKREIEPAVAAAGANHVPELPEKRRGRPRKNTSPDAAA